MYSEWQIYSVLQVFWLTVDLNSLKQNRCRFIVVLSGQLQNSLDFTPEFSICNVQSHNAYTMVNNAVYETALRCFCITQINFSQLSQEWIEIRKALGTSPVYICLPLFKQIIRKVLINRVDPINFPEACKNLV